MFSSAATRKGSRLKDYHAEKELNFRVELPSVCKVNIWPNTRKFQHEYNLGVIGILGSEPDSLQLLYTKIEPCSRNTNHEDFLISPMNLSSAESARMACRVIADFVLVNKTRLIVEREHIPYFYFFSLLF